MADESNKEVEHIEAYLIALQSAIKSEKKDIADPRHRYVNYKDSFDAYRIKLDPALQAKYQSLFEEVLFALESLKPASMNNQLLDISEEILAVVGEEKPPHSLQSNVSSSEKMALDQDEDKHLILDSKILRNQKTKLSENLDRLNSLPHFNIDTVMQTYIVSTKNILAEDKYSIDDLNAKNIEIESILTAHNSPQMQTLLTTVAQFREDGKKWFSVGNNAKADRIMAAILTVPLSQRANIFENINVQKALASHRHIGKQDIQTSRMHQGTEVIEETNAAKTFIRLKNSLLDTKNEKNLSSIASEKAQDPGNESLKPK